MFLLGYDPDDPLADLGLIDEEELQPKRKSPHKKPLSKRLSNEKLKIQPSVNYDDNEETPNKNKLGRNISFLVSGQNYRFFSPKKKKRDRCQILYLILS